MLMMQMFLKMDKNLKQTFYTDNADYKVSESYI